LHPAQPIARQLREFNGPNQPDKLGESGATLANESRFLMALINETIRFDFSQSRPEIL
jgi:hypothetical protein